MALSKFHSLGPQILRTAAKIVVADILTHLVFTANRNILKTYIIRPTYNFLAFCKFRSCLNDTFILFIQYVKYSVYCLTFEIHVLGCKNLEMGT